MPTLFYEFYVDELFIRLTTFDNQTITVYFKPYDIFNVNNPVQAASLKEGDEGTLYYRKGKYYNYFESFEKEGGEFMRLDKYLKVSRLIKRRTIANEACDADKISVNGRIARASYSVKVDDVIEINMGRTPLKIKVLSVVEQVGKDKAAEMYEVC
jgi:ribosomal 50S subunit-recycling heat shock protein